MKHWRAVVVCVLATVYALRALLRRIPVCPFCIKVHNTLPNDLRIA